MRTDLHLGHVHIDHRAGDGGVFEDDIVGCNHCQAAMHRSEWRKKGGYCSCCDSPLCNACAEETKRSGCLPWRKFVDEQLDAQYHRDQNAKVLGL